MDRENLINEVLRMVGVMGVLISIFLSLTQTSYYVVVAIGVISTLCLGILFYRTRDPYLQIARHLKDKYRSKRSIDFKYLFEQLGIRGVKITSEKGINYVGKKGGVEPLEMLKSRAIFSDPRLTEAILCRIIAGIRGNASDETLARDLRMCATLKGEKLLNYLWKELEDIPEEIIPKHVRKLHVWEDQIESDIFLIAEHDVDEPVDVDGERKVERDSIHKDTLVRLESRKVLYAKLCSVYEGYSLEEIKDMTTFVQAICVDAGSGVAQVHIITEDGFVSDVWKFPELKSMDDVLKKLILLYNEDRVNGHIIVEADFPP